MANTHRRREIGLFLVLLAAMAAAACDDDGAQDPAVDTASPDDTAVGPDTTDATDTTDPADMLDTAADADTAPPRPMTDLRLNHVQARGTHNSYHLEPATLADPSHAYTHAPLEVQLEAQGVRQLELDLHEHVSRGFEVFHLPAGIDEETSCRALADCLGRVRAWSLAHPEHLPLVIWFEPKDEDLDWADHSYRPFIDHHDALEAAILEVIPRDAIFAPDDLRGSHATLPEAIAAEGWPRIDALRGRVLFAMLDSSNHRARYLERSPVLAGRLMFVDADTADDPFAAMFKIDDALSDGERIRGLVERGFLVTSNADGAGLDDAQAHARAEATRSAGSHFLSSDFPAPVEGRSYWLELPGGEPARCNPVSAPADCRAADIE